MASVSTYLNFAGNTAEAFEFYKSVFGTEYAGAGMMRMGDIPAGHDAPEMSDEQKQLVMHVSLPTLGGHLLMGTDVTDAQTGNNISIMLGPDTKDDADALFDKLGEGASNVEPMRDEFWGDYYGSLIDRFGIGWMIDVAGEPSD